MPHLSCPKGFQVYSVGFFLHFYLEGRNKWGSNERLGLVVKRFCLSNDQGSIETQRVPNLISSSDKVLLNPYTSKKWYQWYM